MEVGSGEGKLSASSFAGACETFHEKTEGLEVWEVDVKDHGAVQVSTRMGRGTEHVQDGFLSPQTGSFFLSQDYTSFCQLSCLNPCTISFLPPLIHPSSSFTLGAHSTPLTISNEMVGGNFPRNTLELAMHWKWKV